MHERCFVAASAFWQSKIDASLLLQPHDASTPDTALILNHNWRRLLPSLLLQLLNSEIYVGSDSDIDTAIDNVNLLIEGLYADIPTGGSMSEIGDIKIIPYSTIPDGWMRCDGSAISRATYAELFALIGTTYGNGNGSTTFNIPELRGRAVIGAGNNPSLTARSLGSDVGSETHTLTQAQIPSHSHTTQYGISGTPGGAAVIVRGNLGSGEGTTLVNNTTGGGGSHNNMQPSTALNYIIRIE